MKAFTAYIHIAGYMPENKVETIYINESHVVAVIPGSKERCQILTVTGVVYNVAGEAIVVAERLGWDE